MAICRLNPPGCRFPLHVMEQKTSRKFPGMGFSRSVSCHFRSQGAAIRAIRPQRRQVRESISLWKWCSCKEVMAVECAEISSKQRSHPFRRSKSIVVGRSDLDWRKEIRKAGKKEHHLWKKRESAGSGQKALNLINIISEVPNEKEAVYGALNKWIAWETEFPVIAAAKALCILRKRSQWRRVIQVAKWMLSKGQGATMGTYDTLLLAFDMDHRVDEAESLWNMILHTHTRSISKRVFSRMVSLYNHHGETEKMVEVFADMEELGVRPDEDTVRKVARAFGKLGLEDKQKLVLRRYLGKWKYVHFNGERVRVRRHCSGEDEE